MNASIIQNHCLTDQQQKALNTLLMQCKQADLNTIPTYPHLLRKKRPLPGNLLYFQNNKLLGFLAAFFFYNEACEITLMVSKPFRRQKIATLMLKALIPLLESQRITNVIFSTPTCCNGDWLEKLGMVYKGSEYQMQCTHIISPPINYDKFCVRMATHQDWASLSAINEACFPTKRPGENPDFQLLLKNKEYQLFIIEQKGKIVGKLHMQRLENTVRFTDIGILPIQQNQGIGSYLLVSCMSYVQKTYGLPITLDVETSNRKALNLYLRQGFEMNNAYDFWIMPFKTLQTWIENNG
jgi:GNAT superfamily N-acetyltransferase